MGATVDGWPAGIHTDDPRLQRNKFLFSFRQGVIEDKGHDTKDTKQRLLFSYVPMDLLGDWVALLESDHEGDHWVIID